MGRDTHEEEATDETHDQTDRREFLKQAGMVGGGALATLAGLASAADAQGDIRTLPESRMKPRIPENFIKAPDVASVEEFKKAFARIKEYTDTQGPAPSWAETMANMSPPDRVGGVAILEMRQRFKESPNVGRNLVVLFSTLAAGMESVMPGDRVSTGAGAGGGPHATGTGSRESRGGFIADVRALGNGCGTGCGNGCGTGCMSAVASGFICGDGCGQGCNGAEAAGLMCGGGCDATGLKQVSFDREGIALKDVRLKGLDMRATSAAMRNADRAYSEVFGR